MTQAMLFLVFSPPGRIGLLTPAPHLSGGHARRSGQPPLLSAYPSGPNASVGQTPSVLARTPVVTRMGQTRTEISMSRQGGMQ
jgi:hypothetical protein